MSGMIDTDGLNGWTATMHWMSPGLTKQRVGCFEIRENASVVDGGAGVSPVL
jgi:hypothetical protein